MSTTGTRRDSAFVEERFWKPVLPCGDRQPLTGFQRLEWLANLAAGRLEQLRRGRVGSPLLHLADLRSRYTGLPYGDQAAFVRRDVFQAIGGFADLELMEDLDLCRRLRRRGRIVTVPSSVTVSGRRFLARPVFYTFVVNVFPLLYRLGVPDETLSALYGHVR
jgi:hypothetical protein